MSSDTYNEMVILNEKIKECKHRNNRLYRTYLLNEKQCDLINSIFDEFIEVVGKAWEEKYKEV